MNNTVEGWTNYETWAINLHIDNNQPLHEAKNDWMKNNEVNAETIQHWVTEKLPSGITDVRRSKYRKINWKEIAEDWKGRF